MEEIEPILRYCRYNLDTATGSVGDAAAAEKQLVEMGRQDSSAGGDLLAAKLESVVAEARKKQASTLHSVEWRGKRVPVRSETLRVALVKADELARRLYQLTDGAREGEASGSDPKPGQYLKVFGAYDDALATVSEEASRLQGKGGGVKMDTHRGELEALRAYAQHHKLRLMLQRNERLVQELQEKRNAAGAGAGDGAERDPVGEVADIVHVYDALLQSVRNMVSNLGGGDDANGEIRDMTLFVATVLWNTEPLAGRQLWGGSHLWHHISARVACLCDTLALLGGDPPARCPADSVAGLAMRASSLLCLNFEHLFYWTVCHVSCTVGVNKKDDTIGLGGARTRGLRCSGAALGRS